jgi:ATP-binding cassette subfamily C protein/ATP-binding cassette subfamily C protein EexD
MDEPNASLDTDGELALRQALAQLKADQCTVVVVTHRPQLLAHVDYVLVIKEGRKCSFGPRDEILARSEKPNVSLLNASKSTASSRSTRELGVSLETPAA